MVSIRARRLSEKDLLAFCNELASELGGGAKKGLKFGIEEKEGRQTIWLFGKKLKTEDEDG